jgi:RNA polymerase sigma factor (sigma-70 family)
MFFDMAQTWDTMTPKERNKYINQDFVPRSYMLVDPDTFTDEHSTVKDMFDARLETHGIEHMLSHLTDKQQEAVEMHYLHGMTLRQIGKEIGIAQQNVRNRLEFARKKLRKLYR